jgi:hypothetical protein
MKRKIITVLLASISLGSCGRVESPDPRGEQITEFQVVDVNGDTIIIKLTTNPGIPSKAYKKPRKD